MREPTSRIRVFLVDDHALVRQSLRALLRSNTGMEVVGEAGGLSGLSEAVRQVRPHVVLMDISLGAEKLDGIKGVKIAREACPEVAVLILSMHDDYELLVEAARAGASGYLVKACTSEELVAAIRAVASGGGWLSPMMARKAMDLLAGAASVHAGQEKRDVASGRLGLTEREQEILGMIARGYKYQEIGEALFISTSQVKQIARRICEKIGARDKAHAAAIAVADGLVAPSQLTSQAGEAVSTGLLS